MSFGVIVLVIVVTFSSFIRSLWWCATHYCVNWLLIHSGLYHLWLVMPENVQPDKMIAWSEKQVNAMKRRVKKQVGEEAIRRLEEKALEREEDGNGRESGGLSGRRHSGIMSNGNDVPTFSHRERRPPSAQGVTHPAREGRQNLENSP